MRPWTLIFAALASVGACRSAPSSQPEATSSVASTFTQAKPVVADTHKALAFVARRSKEDACATFASKPHGDPFVIWGKHFPVETLGILAHAPSSVVDAGGLRQRMSALNLRAETFDIIDCKDFSLIWLRFDGGCAMVDREFKELSDTVGPLSLVACFSYLWSEVAEDCYTGQAPREKCWYILAPSLSVPGCGRSSEREQARMRELMIKVGLSSEGTRVCDP